MNTPGSGPFDLSEQIFNEIASPVFILDSLLRVVHWNHAIAAMTAISLDQIRGVAFGESVLFQEDFARWTSEMNGISDECPRIKVNSRWRVGGAAPVTCACVLVSTAGEYRIVCTVVDPVTAADRASISRECLEDRSSELREISRFLHDTVSQILVRLSFSVNIIHDAARHLPGLSETASAMELTDLCCRYIRILSCMVAPPSLAESTLDGAIEQYAGYFRDETGVSTTLDFDPLPAVPLEVKFLLFAVVQMWSARSFRIGREGTVTVRLRNPASAVVLELETCAAKPHMRPAEFLGGWSIIRERVAALGGRFGISAGSDNAQARIWLPGVAPGVAQGVAQGVALESAAI